MKHGFRSGMLLVICLVALGLLGQAQAGKRVKETITGKVRVAETHRDKVKAVYIEAAEQGRFIVSRGTEIGKELLELVGEEIRATGYVGKATRDKNFDTYIDVLEYEVISVTADAR